jgi:hypothetical protein
LLWKYPKCGNINAGNQKGFQNLNEQSKNIEQIIWTLEKINKLLICQVTHEKNAIEL